MNPVKMSSLFLISMLAGALTYGLPSRPSRAAETPVAAAVSDSSCREDCDAQLARCQLECGVDLACHCACRNEHGFCLFTCDGEERPPDICG
jgi:hypothetical protein